MSKINLGLLAAVLAISLASTDIVLAGSHSSSANAKQSNSNNTYRPPQNNSGGQANYRRSYNGTYAHSSTNNNSTNR